MDAASLKDAGTGSPLLRLSPFLSAGEEGGWGEGEGPPTVLRSTGAETVEPLCHRVAETHVLTANVSRNTILRTIVEPHRKPKFLITLLHELYRRGEHVETTCSGY